MVNVIKIINITSSADAQTFMAITTSQFLKWVDLMGSQSIRTQVNSYSSQFVLILVNSYSKFWSIRTHLVNSYSCLVSSYSFWSIRTHFGQFVLKLK